MVFHAMFTSMLYAALIMDWEFQGKINMKHKVEIAQVQNV